MTPGVWRVRLGALAEDDYLRILEQTAEMFGSRQADIYEGHLLAALVTLTAGPTPLGNVARPDIRPDLLTYHIARRGVSARHLICYRLAGGQVIEVLRILHDAMGLPQHIPPFAD